MPALVSPRTVRNPTRYAKSFSEFRGVDFSTDPTQVDPRRSPAALNLISDMAGFPEKRPGWRTIAAFPARVNGLYYAVLKSGTGYFLVHAGSALYRYAEGEEPELVFDGLADEKSTGFVHAGRLFLLDGSRYSVLVEGENGLSLLPVSDIAFIPTTTIAMSPSGDGTAFEDVNLLTPWRKNSFAGTEGEKVYQLDTTDLDDAPVTAAVNGTEMTEGNGFTVDRQKGRITFATAPGVSPGGAGVDNVVITFAKTVPGYAERINRCRCFAFFGYNNDNRVFLSGNPEHKNTDWRSGLDDPTYFPDLGYTKIGSDTSAILGYLKQRDALIIVKEENDQDAELFLRTAVFSEDGSVIFPVKQGAKGVGAVSPYAFASLRDDPLFLSESGVYAVASVGVTEQRALQKRSSRVDAKLCAESGLSNAVCAVWNGYYLLCVNSRCYVADSRQKSGSAESFEYEWYYWDNVPARVFLPQNGELFFGTEDGRLAKFNTDIDTTARFSDDGAPILARWSTRAESFGDFTVRKTLQKRGCGVMIKPYARSGVEVYYLTESSHKGLLCSANMDIFDFSDMDFSRVDFNTLDMPQIKPFNARIRRFNIIQLVFENSRANEGFGIYGAKLAFSTENFIR